MPPSRSDASSRRRPTREPPSLVPPEVTTCPECRTPMFPTWGTTCGTCRPAGGRLRAPSVAAAARRHEPALGLGWLALVNGPDAERLGCVVPLEAPVTVLTRAGAVAGVGAEIEIRDDYLSAGHAVVRARDTGERRRFTLEDRREPGPSANGTHLNGRRLAHGEVVDLADGDELRVGATELVFTSLVVPGGRP